MNDKKLTDIAKTALDQKTEALSSDTQHRLRLAREQALKQAVKESWTHWLSWRWLSGVGAGVALASVIAFMIVPNVQTTPNSLSPLDDLDLLTAEVDMDLVDDLEFYQWLDESLSDGSDES